MANLSTIYDNNMICLLSVLYCILSKEVEVTNEDGSDDKQKGTNANEDLTIAADDEIKDENKILDGFESSEEEAKDKDKDLAIDRSDNNSNDAESNIENADTDTNSVEHDADVDADTKGEEENKQEYSGSRDDLIAQGYEPCKKCNP